MDIQLSDEVIGGLLGGGVAGAIIAGLIALTTQARLFRREDRYRFNEKKREKYASLFVAAEDWFNKIYQHWFALVLARRGIQEPFVPADAPTRIKTLIQEVRLLGDVHVERAATNLLIHVEVLEVLRQRFIEKGKEAVLTRDELLSIGEKDDKDAERVGASTVLLSQFFEAARLDLGTARLGPLAALVRRLRGRPKLYRL